MCAGASLQTPRDPPWTPLRGRGGARASGGRLRSKETIEDDPNGDELLGIQQVTILTDDHRVRVEDVELALELLEELRQVESEASRDVDHDDIQAYARGDIDADGADTHLTRPADLREHTKQTIDACIMVKGDKLALRTAGYFIEKSKLQHFFTRGHAADFGVSGNWSTDNGSVLANALDHWISTRVPVSGSYHGVTGSWFYDSASTTGVFFDDAGDLVTGFKFRPGQAIDFPFVKN